MGKVSEHYSGDGMLPDRKIWWDQLSLQWKNVLMINYKLERFLNEELKANFVPGETPYCRYERSFGKPFELSEHEVNEAILEQITRVKKIDCYGVALDSSLPLARFQDLEEFYCGSSLIDNLDYLHGARELQKVCLFGTQIIDLRDANIPPTIKNLCIGGSKVKDLTMLVNFPFLERLSIIETKVRNLKPLYNLKRLTFLKCFGAPLSDSEILEFQQACPLCKVISNANSNEASIDIFAD